jgi:hypothetical protein
MDQSFSFVILFVCTTLLNCHFNWLVVQCQQTLNRCPKPFEFSTIINASPSFEGIVYVCMIVYNGLLNCQLFIVDDLLLLLSVLCLLSYSIVQNYDNFGCIYNLYI